MAQNPATAVAKAAEGVKAPNMYEKPAPSSMPAEGAKAAMPVMHKGGMVEKDGPAMLQKGEEVVPAPTQAKKASKAGGGNLMTKDEGHKKASQSKSAKKHNGFRKTTITHHSDGTHSVEHEHENHPRHSVSGSHADLNGVHQSLDANIGAGSQAAPDMPPAAAGPAMADAGAVPAAAAAPVAAPAAAPAPTAAARDRTAKAAAADSRAISGPPPSASPG